MDTVIGTDIFIQLIESPVPLGQIGASFFHHSLFILPSLNLYFVRSSHNQANIMEGVLHPLRHDEYVVFSRLKASFDLYTFFIIILAIHPAEPSVNLSLQDDYPHPAVIVVLFSSEKPFVLLIDGKTSLCFLFQAEFPYYYFLFCWGYFAVSPVLVMMLSPYIHTRKECCNVVRPDGIPMDEPIALRCGKEGNFLESSFCNCDRD